MPFGNFKKLERNSETYMVILILPSLVSYVLLGLSVKSRTAHRLRTQHKNQQIVFKARKSRKK